MKNVLVTITIAFALISCNISQKDNKASKTITIIENEKELPYKIGLPERNEGSLKTSMIANDVQFIPLETNKNSIIGRGGQIRINDSLIVISDRKKILLFERSGKFIRQIGTNGKGPGEYLMIFDFELKGDTIFLTSVGKRSMIKYTLDGKFQEEIEIGNQLTHFSLSPDEHIIWYSPKRRELIFYNQMMKPINTLNPENLTKLPDKYSIWDTFDTYFQVSKNKLLFSTYFSDTIWNISNGEQKAAYILNLKDKLLPYEVLIKSYHEQNFEKFTKQAANYQKVNLFEGQNTLFVFQKAWNDNNLNAIYTHDFETDITKKYTAPYIYDDMLSGMELRIKSENQCSEKILVSFINPVNLLKELEKENTEGRSEAYEAWKAKMQKVKYDDNPVVAIINLK